MKNLVFLWCVVLITSCDMPESVTVKGNPGIYIPLGKFSQMGDTGITDLISDGEIKKMMGGNDSGIKIYSYEPSSDPTNNVLTYLIHYPIAEMNLDLTDYVDKLNGEMPGLDKDIPGGLPVPIPISLDSMGDWIKEITGAKFSLKLTSTKDSGSVTVVFNRNNIELSTETKIITTEETFTSGTISSPFNPKTDKITITVTAPEGTSFKPELSFNWVEAKVSPGDAGEFRGEYTIAIGDLTSFLGDGVEFEKVTGYIYVNGLPDDSQNTNKNKMTLTANGNNLVDDDIIGQELNLPDTDDWTIAIPKGSVTDANLTDTFNAGGQFQLEYAITMDEATIKNDNSSNLSTITADMLIELPLKFKVSTSSSLSNYVKLELGGNLFPEPEDGETKDLFGRKPDGDGDDLFENIEYVQITLRDIENTILPDISLYAGIGEPILLKKGENPKPISIYDLTPPFSPNFQILIEKVAGENYGTFAIGKTDPQNPPVFDFSLDLEAKASINQKIDLQ